MRVVIDTNVIVSALISPGGTPRLIVRHWEAGRFSLVVSNDLLTEYGEVLRRPRISARHGRSHAQLKKIVRSFGQVGILVVTGSQERVVPTDPGDDMLFACAVAGGASYVVSDDAAVHAVREYQGIRVLSSQTFLALLEGLEPASP